MRPTRIFTALAVVVLGTVAFAGCSQTPAADDSFEEKIPTALEASDLGIIDATAGKGVDGLTTYVIVGATFDRAVLSTADVQKFVTLIVENNTVSVTNLRLSVEDADGEDIDIEPQLEELGATPFVGAFLNLSLEDAEAIASGAR